MAEKKSGWDNPKPKTEKQKALESVLDTSEEKQRFPAYLPESKLRRMKMMAAKSVNNIAVNDLVLEAIDDLLTKYDAGKGRHALHDD